MEAQPRLRAGKTPTESKGHLLQALVMPGRNEAANGSGGKDKTKEPATTHNEHTVSRQRHDSRCHEAGHDGTEKRVSPAKTRQEATKRNPTISNDALATSAAKAFRWCVEMDSATESPVGQRVIDVTQQNGMSHQIRRAAHPSRCHEARAIKVASAAVDMTRPQSEKPSNLEAAGIRMPRSETSPVATTYWRMALPRHQVTPLREATRRKAPAANQPRNNVARHRHLEQRRESKSKRPFQKIRRGITAALQPRPVQQRKQASGCQICAASTTNEGISNQRAEQALRGKKTKPPAASVELASIRHEGVIFRFNPNESDWHFNHGGSACWSVKSRLFASPK